MKQVNPKYYDQKYFEFQSASPNFKKKITPSNFVKKYQEIASLISLAPSDHICDFGCGNGDLSFLLSLKYHCRISSIDYSPDAINICQSNLALFQKNTNPNPNIKFYNRDNQHLPSLKKIKAVYFCDVFEHLYPSEIKFIIKSITKWGNPDIVVHTDNNLYLKYVEPVIELICLLTKKTTKDQLRQQKKFHQKRHVNLTNPYRLKKDMAKLGYYQVKLQYPQIDQKTIRQQLGPLSKFGFLVSVSSFVLKLFPIFFPSFYSVYSSKNHTNF